MFYQTPCQTAVGDSISSNLTALTAVGFTLGIIELLGVIFSAVMFVKVAKRDGATNVLLADNWRLGISRIHHGYSHYQPSS